MKLRYVFLFAVSVLLLTQDGWSAPAKKPRKMIDCQARVDKALRRYEKRRYNEAATYLDEVRYQCGGHSIIDTVLYYLGMSYLQGKKPIEAQTEFERLIQNYPNSAWFQEAHFRVADCVFRQSKDYSRDQTETRNAIVRLREFIEIYPTHPLGDSASLLIAKCYDKLARKEFENARFYERIDEPEAAVVYYRAVADDYPESEYVADALLNLAQALIKTDRVTEASAVITELESGSFSADVKSKAAQLKVRLK